MVVHEGILAPPDVPPKVDDTGLNLFFSFGNYGLLNRGFLIHGTFVQGRGEFLRSTGCGSEKCEISCFWLSFPLLLMVIAPWPGTISPHVVISQQKETMPPLGGVKVWVLGLVPGLG